MDRESSFKIQLMSAVSYSTPFYSCRTSSDISVQNRYIGINPGTQSPEYPLC